MLILVYIAQLFIGCYENLLEIEKRNEELDKLDREEREKEDERKGEGGFKGEKDERRGKFEWSVRDIYDVRGMEGNIFGKDFIFWNLNNSD